MRPELEGVLSSFDRILEQIIAESHTIEGLVRHVLEQADAGRISYPTCAALLRDIEVQGTRLVGAHARLMRAMAAMGGKV